MGLTMAEKVIARSAGLSRVEPGDMVVADVDLVFGHDGSFPLALEVMKEMGREEPWDSEKVVLFIDHSAPSPTPEISNLHRAMREFSKKSGVRLYDVGNGICHQVLPEEGFIKPGMLIVGADSHTVTHGAFGCFAIGVGSTDAAVAITSGKIWLRVPESVKIELKGELRGPVTTKDVILKVIGDVKADGMNYKSVEFHGDSVDYLSMASRMTITNMGAEMGAKATMMPVNGTARQMIRREFGLEVKEFLPDSDADYSDILEADLSSIVPMVACPPNVDIVRPVEELSGTVIDQAFIGSCTNGRLEDLHLAASILRGKKVKVRCIVIPASRKIFLEAVRDGTVEVLSKAGCVVGPPTCGPCVGAHMGLLGSGEVAVSTSNRNFPGRMGDRNAKIYLVSPATAAASALEGEIADPRRYV